MAPIAWGPGSVTCEDHNIDVPSIVIPSLPAVRRDPSPTKNTREDAKKLGTNIGRNGARTALGRLETASPSQRSRARKPLQNAGRDGARTACGRLEEIRDQRACLTPVASPKHGNRGGSALGGILENEEEASPIGRQRSGMRASTIAEKKGKQKASSAPEDEVCQNEAMTPEVVDFISKLQNRITTLTGKTSEEDDRRLSERIRCRARSQQGVVRVLIQEDAPLRAETPFDRLETGSHATYVSPESTMGDTALSGGGSPTPRQKRMSKTNDREPIQNYLVDCSSNSISKEKSTPSSKTTKRHHARERDKSLDKNMFDSETPIVHAIVPPDHRGFELGGRNGNLVVQVHGGSDSFVQLDTGGLQESRVLLEKGWKVVGFDFHRCPTRWIQAKILKARLQNRECCVTFEVTKDAAARLGKSVCEQAMARFFLEEHFSCKSLVEIEQLDIEMKREFLRNPKLLWLVVSAKACMELEVLLGTKNAVMLQLSLDMRRALRLGHFQELEMLMQHEMAWDALIQRDGGGNVVLHYCKDLSSLRMLYDRNPQAKNVKNSNKQLPLHSYLVRNSEDPEILHLLTSSEADLFESDDNGVSAAMLTQGQARELVEKLVTPWEDVKEVLQLPYSEVLEALGRLEPQGLWPALLSFHCFGESRVWKDGRHTANSRSRLEVVWGCIWRCLQSLSRCLPLDRDPLGASVAQVLLEASKGPRHHRLDSREVYRQELTDILLRIDEGCRRILHGHYRELVKSDVAEWLLSTPSEMDTTTCCEELVSLGLKPRLQCRVPPPEWLAVPDLQHIFDDLQRQKIIGENKSCAVHDLLLLANVCPEDSLDHNAGNDMVLMRWYAAWLQSVCHEQQHYLSEKVESGLAINTDARVGDTVRTICLEEVCHKTAQLLRQLRTEWATCMPPYMSEASDGASVRRQARSKQKLTREGPRLVHDMNVCSVTAGDTDELYKLYDKVLQSGLKIVRTDNAFSRSSKVLSSFRDLTMSVECPTDHGPLIVDIQLNLEAFISEKRLSHLCEKYFQGELDWHHVSTKSRIRNARDAREALQEALNKKHAPSVLAALNRAAKVGVDERCISMAEQSLGTLTEELLQKAITERNTSKLQLGINIAICVPTETCMTDAVRLLAQLEKEANERHAASEMIVAALLKKDTKELRQALLKAQTCNLESEQVDMAEKIFERQIDQIEEAMNHALNKKDFVAIANALRDAWNAGLDHEGIELAQEILQELQALDRYAKAVESKDPEEIHNAVLEMQVLELKGPDVEKAEALWRTLKNVPLRLRACKNTKGVRAESAWVQFELQNTKEAQQEAEVIRMLENALRSRKPATLNAAIARAKRLDISCPQLTAAERLLKRFISEAETILLMAMQQTNRTGDHRGLYDAINTARSVGCNPHNILKAESILSRQLAATALKEAMASGDSGTLQETIIDAESKDVDTGLIKSAEEQLAKFRRASMSLREAMEIENVEQIRDLLKIAERAQVNGVLVRSAGACLSRLQARAGEMLQLAMNDRNLEDMHYALIFGRKAGVDACTMQDAVNAFQDMKTDASKMLESIAVDELDVSITVLEKDIAVAKLVGLEMALIRRAESAIARRMQVQNTLQEAVNTSNLVAVRLAIGNAKKAGALKADLKAAYDFMNEIKANATVQLRKAMNCKDPTQIHEAIHDAMNAGVEDHFLRDAEWLVSKLTQGLSLLTKAIKSKKSCCADLHNAISNAYALGLNSGEVGVAEKLLASRKDKSLKLLNAAIKHKDPKALKQSIAEAKKSMLTEKEELDVLAKAEYLLYGYVTSLEEELKSAMKARDLHKLEETITEAWSSNIELKLIQDAKALLASLYDEESSAKDVPDDGGSRKVVLGQCKNVYGLDLRPTPEPLPTEEEEEEVLAEMAKISAPRIHTS